MRNRRKTIQKRIVFSVFAGIFCLFFFRCGIPVYYVIEPPQADRIPTYETDDASQKFFQFICPYSSSSENSDFYLSGTDVYYRIYDSLDKMNSDISSISSSNSEYSENGFSRINDLNYQALWSSTGDTPVIKKMTSNRTIRIRLCTETQYPAEIYDKTNENNISIPYRKGTGSSSSGNMSFQFTSNYHPLPGDQDTSISDSSQNSGIWYINLYAVSVGRDSSLVPHYSSLLHLGNLKIVQSQ
ncbi:MAG: hypothetical protein K5930_05015 [Treponemataceae bacterium]|nr:hypothetical protein [Treponemataceae bacterium]